MSYSNLRLKLRVTKIVKQTNFEGVWGELEGKYCFQRKSWPKYMRQTERVHCGISSISIFQQFFSSIEKILILERRLSTRL